MSQAHYDVFREQLAIKYPAFGHALWEPNPRNPDRPVQVGDVGFVSRGKFHRLFNALLPADDPSHERGVPEYHEPLVPSLSDHIDKGSLDSNNYCSAGVKVEGDPGYHASAPTDFRQVSFQYERTRGAAVLSLPVAARSENTLARGDFGRWMVKHIGTWFAFARKLGLGIDQMEDIILVTGCDHSRSWTNIAFLGGQADAQVTFGVRVEGNDPTINFQFSPENACGGILRHGPQGKNLPENQCVFIRGFRVARSFWILPKHLKAAAGPSSDPGGYDCNPGTELVSIPAATQYGDPLHILLGHIAEASTTGLKVSDCDMVIAHDDDLVAIDGLGPNTLLESLEPDVMVDLLRRSNIEIHKIWCDSSPSNDPSSSSNTGMAIVKVAMLSMTFQNWNTTSLFQRPPLAGQSIDLGHTSEHRGTPPPAVPGSLPAPTTRGDTNNHDVPLLEEHGDSVSTTLRDFGDCAPLDGGHDAEDTLLPDKTGNSLSGVWSSLQGSGHVGRHRLVAAIVATCCIVLLCGWIFSFTLDAIFKLFFNLLLASIPLSVLFERKNTHRRLDNIYERMDAIQYHVMSLQTNLAMPAVVEGVRYSAPIMSSMVPATPGVIPGSPTFIPPQPIVPPQPIFVHPPGRSHVVYPYGTPTPSASPVVPSPPSRWGDVPFIPPEIGPSRTFNPPTVYQPPIPSSSPPANAQRKRRIPRSSNIFDRIKFSFPSRTARPVPPSPATAGSVLYPPSPPTNAQNKPRSSKFLNRIRYAFTTRPPSPIQLNYTTVEPSPDRSQPPVTIVMPSRHHHRTRAPTMSRTPSPPYPMPAYPMPRPTIVNMPQQSYAGPGVVVYPSRSPSPRTPSPASSVRRHRTRTRTESRSTSPPYPIPGPTIINVPSQSGGVVVLSSRSPSPRTPSPAPYRRYRSSRARVSSRSRAPSPDPYRPSRRRTRVPSRYRTPSPIPDRRRRTRVPSRSPTPSPDPYRRRRTRAPSRSRTPSPAPDRRHETRVPRSRTPSPAPDRRHRTRVPRSRTPSPVPYSRHRTRVSSRRRTPSPVSYSRYRARVPTQPRTPSPASYRSRYRTRPSPPRTPSPPYPIQHPTIINVAPKPEPVTRSVPLHSPSPRYPPTSPIIIPAFSPPQHVQSSDDRTTSIPSLRTHQRPEEVTLLESL